VRCATPSTSRPRVPLSKGRHDHAVAEFLHTIRTRAGLPPTPDAETARRVFPDRVQGPASPALVAELGEQVLGDVLDLPTTPATRAHTE